MTIPVHENEVQTQLSHISVCFTYGRSLCSSIYVFEGLKVSFLQPLLIRESLLHDMNRYLLCSVRFGSSCRLHNSFYGLDFSFYSLNFSDGYCWGRLMIRQSSTHHQKIWRGISQQLENDSPVKTQLGREIFDLHNASSKLYYQVIKR